MIATAVLGFAAIALFSVVPSFWLALLCLTGFGYLSAVNALLQYALIQAQTPDHLLGRVNGLWTAQNVTGDALGAALLGGLGSWLLPARAALVFGLAAIVVGLVLALTMRQLRQVQFDAEASAVPARG
nr:hypothetical protein [Pseudomonas amygdali]